MWGLAGAVVLLLGGGAFVWSSSEREVDLAAEACAREYDATSRRPLSEAAARVSAICAGMFAEQACADALRRVPGRRGPEAQTSVWEACRAAYCPLPIALQDARVPVCDPDGGMPWVAFAALAHLSDRRPFSLSPERRQAFTAGDRAVAKLLEGLEFDASYIVLMTMDEGDQVVELRSREGALLATVRGMSSSLDAESVLGAIPAGGLADAGVELRAEKQVLFGPVRRLMNACVQQHCRLSLETITPGR